MAIVIKGVPTKKLFPKSVSADDNGFKIYSFLPNDTTDLNISEYGTIVIKGTLPELMLKRECELEVNYEFKNGRAAYVVDRVLSATRPTTGDDAYVYLCELTSESRANAILSAYPDAINIIKSGGKLDIKNIKGVGVKTMEKISEKIMEHYVYYDIITEFKSYDFTMNQIKKLMNHFKTADNVRMQINRNPYSALVSVAGIGFKIADAKILHQNMKFLQSSYRMTEAILYLLSENEVNGSTYINRDDLYAQAKEIVPEAIHLFARAIEKSERIYYDKEHDRVAKLVTYLCECDVAELLMQLSSKTFPKREDEEKAWWKPKWKDQNNNFVRSDKIGEKYKHIGEFDLTEDQQKVIPAVIDNNVVILAGYAGAGKSSSCEALIEFLEDNSKDYMLLAPTGRAASVLSGYTNRPASTIHRALGAKGDGFFDYDEHNKLCTDIVIVDEATMADVFLIRALLKALPITTKVLFVCDPAQIPSVGAGNVIQDMIRSKRFPVIMLDKVFRYGEGGLSYVATKTRKGESFLNKNNDDEQVFGKNEDYIFKQTESTDIVNEAVKRYIALYKNGVPINDIVIVSCYNKGDYGTLVINNTIQKIINPPKAKNDAIVGYTKDKINVLFNVGDRVMQTQNNYHVKKINGIDEFDDECVLFNGDFGIIDEITNDQELICTFGENKVKISKQEVTSLVLGYSVSCHKMQGDNRKHIIFITPKSHTYMLNRNLIYVALTRAKEKLYHYGDMETIRKSLFKSENISRKTFLEQLLRQQKNI